MLVCIPNSNNNITYFIDAAILTTNTILVLYNIVVLSIRSLHNIIVKKSDFDNKPSNYQHEQQQQQQTSPAREK